MISKNLMTNPEEDLSGYNTAYCDSIAVLEQAWRSGLPTSARILSSSPAMLLQGHAEPAYRKFDGAQRTALNDSTLALTLRIYDALKGHEDLAPYATLVAQMGILFQPTIALAASLDDADHGEPRAILMSHTGHGPTDRLFKAPWAGLFAGMPKAKCVTFSIPMEESYLLRGGNAPGFMTRLKQAAWDKLAYRLLLKVGSCFPGLMSRKRAFIITENELLIETSTSLGLAGFSLLRLSQPAFQTSGADSASVENIKVGMREAIGPILHDHAERWINEKFVGNTIEMFLDKVMIECTLFLSANAAWEARLGQLSVGGGDVVLMNYPGGGAIHALINQCRKRRVPVIAFEHGATRQFCATHKHMMAGFENNYADWVMAFNTLSSKMSNANPFAHGTSLPVGFPKDYFRNIGRKIDPEKPPVLFVSTTLYVGNQQSLSGSLSDIEAAEREIGIVTNILDEIPHKVEYKPYPSIRYADPDPIHQAVHESENISFFDEGIDLRYEVGKYRVVITSRATSTVSWCIMSARPLVFINYPDHMPLTDAAHEAFRKGVFLFEVEKDGWQEELRAFLSKPISDIEAEWERKSANRAHLISDFFTIPEQGAGRRAADYIRQIASNGTVREMPSVPPEALRQAP